MTTIVSKTTTYNRLLFCYTNRWMDGSMYQQMNQWVYGCIDESIEDQWVYGWMSRCINRWINGMYGCIDESIEDQWVYGWID